MRHPAILLIRPPATYRRGSSRPSVSLPLGLLYVAAALERSGHETQVFDAQVCPAMPLSREQGDVVHLGLPWKDAEAEIGRRRADVVGITCPFTTQVENAIRTAEIVKGIDRRILTVVGGSHPTVRPEDFFLRTDAVDLVCLGEGEQTMVEIADAVRAGRSFDRIPGTAARDGGGTRRNAPRPPIANLDELPLPAYHLVALEDYFLLQGRGFTDRPAAVPRGTERAVSVITSRGCPFNCVFCSIHLHMGRKWRAHSVGYVLAHLDHLVSKFGINHVHFEDDNISASPRRFRELVGGLIRAGNRFTWDTPNGVRVDTLTKGILADCKKSGCVYVIFGVESGNQRVLSEIVDKRLDLAAVTRAARWCAEIALDAMSFFVIGFPGETRRDMQETVDFALRLQRDFDLNPGLFVATPLPGTRLEQAFLEKGLLPGNLSAEMLSRMTQGAVVLDGDSFTAGDVLEAQRRFRRGYKANAARNFVAFLARNPRAVAACLRRIVGAPGRKPVAEELLDAYLFKNFIAGISRNA